MVLILKALLPTLSPLASPSLSASVMDQTDTACLKAQRHWVANAHIRSTRNKTKNHAAGAARPESCPVTYLINKQTNKNLRCGCTRAARSKRPNTPGFFFSKHTGSTGCRGYTGSTGCRGYMKFQLAPTGPTAATELLHVCTNQLAIHQDSNSYTLSTAATTTLNPAVWQHTLLSASPLQNHESPSHKPTCVHTAHKQQS